MLSERHPSRQMPTGLIRHERLLGIHLNVEASRGQAGMGPPNDTG